MKIALIIHNKVREKSFYVKNGEAYQLTDDKPYSDKGSIQNKNFRNIWNIPFVFDGYFISANDRLPKIDFDLIIAVSEPVIQKRKYLKNKKLNEEKFVAKLRQKYKNAIIIGCNKEFHPGIYYNEGFINFLNLCDAAFLPMQQKYIDIIQPMVNKPIHQIFFPYNIAAIRKVFLNKSAKEKTIFIGASKQSEQIKGAQISRGYNDSLKFGYYLGKKYGYEVIARDKKLTWEEWLQCVNKTVICLNLDPTPRFGQAVIDCAILETPHLGSHLDAAEYLFPTTATNDKTLLEQQFCELINNPDDLTKHALQKAEERYSFSTFKTQLINIVKGRIKLRV